MRLLHSLVKTHALFDDPNLVSHAGLVPVMALAERAGLRPEEPTVVTGGPSCQAFSTAGQRGSVSDPRGIMFRTLTWPARLKITSWPCTRKLIAWDSRTSAKFTCTRLRG